MSAYDYLRLGSEEFFKQYRNLDPDEFEMSFERNKQLMESALEGNLHSLEGDLRNGAQINARDSYLYESKNRTALIWAICNNHWAVVDRLLVVPGIDIEAEDDDGETAFLFACRGRNLALVQKLLSLGIDPLRQRNRRGETGLHKACACHHYNTVRFLLVDCNLDPNVENENGWTALHEAACRQNSYAIIPLLLKHGANISARARRNRTPLLIMIQENPSSAITTIGLLLQHGARIDGKDTTGSTALHFAVSGRKPSIGLIQSLVIRLPNLISLRDNHGETPFETTSRSYVRKFLLETHKKHLLLRHGPLAIHAVLRVADFHAILDRMELADLGSVSIAKFRTFLKSFDANMISIRDNIDNGALPIHVACAQGAPSNILSVLVELDPNTLQIPDSTGATPLHTACGRRDRFDLSSLRFLVDRGGPDPLRARDQGGNLPLHRLLRALPRRGLLPSVSLLANDARARHDELTAVKYLIDANKESISVATNEGEFPLVVAIQAGVSVDILFTLLRANPAALSLSTSTPTTH